MDHGGNSWIHIYLIYSIWSFMMVFLFEFPFIDTTPRNAIITMILTKFQWSMDENRSILNLMVCSLWIPNYRQWKGFLSSVCPLINQGWELVTIPHILYIFPLAQENMKTKTRLANKYRVTYTFCVQRIQKWPNLGMKFICNYKWYFLMSANFIWMICFVLYGFAS